MSVLAVGDLLLRNLLSELSLNPSWEKWRGYLFAASVACSLFPLYMTLGGVPLNCVPVPGRNPSFDEASISRNDSAAENEPIKLSASQTAYINSLCAADGQIFWVRYCGCFLLVSNIVTLVISTAWLHFSNVVDSLRTFGEARDILQNLVLTTNQAKNLIVTAIAHSNDGHGSTSNASNEIHRKVQNAGLLLVAHCNKKVQLCCLPLSISQFYFVRSISVMIFLAAATTLTTYFVALDILDLGESFQCAADIPKDFFGETINLNGHFSCVVNVARTMLTFVFAFSLFNVLQLFTIGYGCWCVRKQLGRHKNLKKSVAFMVALWQNSSPSQSSILKEFTSFLFTDHCREILRQQFREIIKSKDSTLYKILKNLAGEKTQEAIEYVHHIYDINEKETSFNKHVHWKTEYGEILEYWSCSIEDTRTKDFIKKVCKNKLWELLVLVLEKSDLKVKLHVTQNTTDFVKSLKIGEEEPSSMGPRHSILHFAIQPACSFGPVRFAAAKFLLPLLDYTTPAKDIQGLTKETINVKNYLMQLYSSELDRKEIYKELEDVWTKLNLRQPSASRDQSEGTSEKIPLLPKQGARRTPTITCYTPIREDEPHSSSNPSQ